MVRKSHCLSQVQRKSYNINHLYSVQYPSGDWGKVFLYLEANATSAIFAEGNLQHRLEWLVQSLTRSLGWNMELTCLFSYRYKDAVMLPPTTYLARQSPAAKVNLPTLSWVLGEVMSLSTRQHTEVFEYSVSVKNVTCPGMVTSANFLCCESAEDEITFFRVVTCKVVSFYPSSHLL